MLQLVCYVLHLRVGRVIEKGNVKRSSGVFQAQVEGVV
jgi:hypothetical protein